MKTQAILVTALLVIPGLRAQGTVAFINHATIGIQAPVRSPDGVTLARAGSVFVQLQAGPDASSLAPVGMPVLLGPVDGYYRGGEITFPNVAPGTWLWFQVLAWDVRASGFDDARARGLLWGESNVFTDQTGGPPPRPALYLFGLQPMTLVPEPSPALLLAGGAAFLLLGWVRQRPRRMP
jgi:hypothetical protein